MWPARSSFLAYCLCWLLMIETTGCVVTVYATLGLQSVLPCPLSSVINNLQWLGPPGDIPYNLPGTTVLNFDELPADFASRLAVHPTTGALIINNTQRSDANSYICKVLGESITVKLSILVSPQPPLIANTLEDNGLGRMVVWAREDSQVSLVCQIKGGNPQPSVRWIRGGVTWSEVAANKSIQLNTNGTYDVTAITTVTTYRSEDRVKYFCQANHTTWTSSQNASVELYLYHMPMHPVLSEIGSLQEGGNLSVKCSVTRCRPVANLSWTGLQGQQRQTIIWIPEDETYNVISLYTTTVSRQDNGIILQCTVAHSALGASITTSARLVVWFPPANVSITNNKEVTVRQDTLILGCTTETSNPIADISWSNGTSVPTGEMSNKQELPGAYDGKIRTQNLTITPTRYMDGSNITCSAQNFQTMGSSISNSVILSVMYNPMTLISNGSSVSVKEGDSNLALACIAESKPVSSFMWVKDTVTLRTTGPKSDNRDTYTIRQIDRTHCGEYSCIASNGISPNGQGDIYLNVLFPPTNVSITNNKEVTVGQDTLILRCTTGTSNPIANISWSNGTSAPTGELSIKEELPGAYGGKVHFQTLTITPSRHMDRNNIICSAQNSQSTGQSISDSVTLNVRYNPISVISNGSSLSVKEGDTNLALACIAESKPVSSFIWVKDTVTLKTTGPKLDNRDTYTISLVDRTHYGDYSCISNNGISPNGQGNVSLHVMFPPTNVSITNNKEVTAGQDTLILKCTTGTSNPISNISWSNGTSAPTGELSIKKELPGAYGGNIHYQDLTIMPTRYMDGNSITCSAQNSQTTRPRVSDSVVLNVKFSPIIQVTITPRMTVTEGDSQVTIRCSASSKPISYFTLRKEGLTATVSEGSGLQDNRHDYIIQRIDRTYAGRYSCTANNGMVGPHDEMNATVDLVVQYPPTVTIESRNGSQNETGVIIKCSAHGLPALYTFTLTHRSLFSGIEIRQMSYESISAGVIIHQFINPSFMDTGVYTCSVNNKILDYTDGSFDKSESETVWIRGSPYVTSEEHIFSAETGHSGRLVVEFYNSLLDPLVTWYKHKSGTLEKLLNSNKYNIILASAMVNVNFYTINIQQPGFIVSLEVRNVTEEDFNLYQVHVQNNVGEMSPLTLELRASGKTQNKSINGMDGLIIGSSVGSAILISILLTAVGVLLYRKRNVINKADNQTKGNDTTGSISGSTGKAKCPQGKEKEADQYLELQNIDSEGSENLNMRSSRIKNYEVLCQRTSDPENAYSYLSNGDKNVYENTNPSGNTD